MAFSFSAPLMIGSLALPSDLLFLCVLLGFGLLYGFFIGRDRAIHVLLSVYLAFVVITNAPVLSTLSRVFSIQSYPALRIIWFLGFFLLIFFVLWRSPILRNMARERGSWWEACLFGVFQIGLVASIALFLLPSEFVQSLPPHIQWVFLDDIGRSFWIMAPIVVLALLKRREEAFDFLP
ncbi:MAG: hypothetical protein WC776_05430 [Patescibacteria group bacterium]|jgi:hypothetical protein